MSTTGDTDKRSVARNDAGPMAWIPPELRGRVFTALATLTVILLGVQVVLDRALAPYGIVGLELAGTPERAGVILMTWGNQGATAAAFGLGLDYLFALAYAATLAMACGALARRAAGGVLHRLGIWLAWGSLAAGAFDLVENTAIAMMLLEGQLAPWAAVATACAVPKFLLAGLAVLYVIVRVVLIPIGR